MTRPVAARGGRLVGRGLLTLANVITVAAPVAADWNDSHSGRWMVHRPPFYPRRERMTSQDRFGD